ncbi:MAG: SDR family NAD(P)-dependent oxidoreductase [Porticoccaceae bacterium]|jgi:NAD(P)-dependent dehydrogenase (short-subunit alcohol dehydrogenase family)|nr:SDR family NAD(P)-dependent oxidoreductase [Porticoccaceae bacterium]MBT5578426.1 SDR family NAD(P)-dependent oxidoreductase [Porticoccaceae bacterium]
MTIRYDGQVAIVTGAGNGLGRSHALALAARGAKVVVNDLGGSVNGVGGSSDAAMETVAMIQAAGGEAIANGANVAKMDEVEAMVAQAVEEWGRVDILVNNAGILRDKSFAKMDMADFQLVVDVHLMGSANCSKAVWELMRAQGYGRIVMTTSSSGMYGNFGQANYGAAKMAVVGLMNTLCIEGEKYNIHVNCLSPTAGTRMLEGLVTEEQSDIMTVESVTAALLTLCDNQAPNRSILCAGAGGYARTHIYETDGIYLAPEQQTPENVRTQMAAIDNPEGQEMLVGGFQQTNKFVAKAAAYLANK